MHLPQTWRSEEEGHSHAAAGKVSQRRAVARGGLHVGTSHRTDDKNEAIRGPPTNGDDLARNPRNRKQEPVEEMRETGPNTQEGGGRDLRAEGE